MKTLIEGIVLKKNKKINEKDPKIAYYNYHLYQDGESEVIEVNCNEAQYNTIQEMKPVRAVVYAKALKDNFGNVKLYCKQATN